MIKKIMPAFLCLCLFFAVICYGENTAETPEMQAPPMGEMPPMGGNPAGRTVTQTPSAFPETGQPANQETENVQSPDTVTGATPMGNMPAGGEQRGEGRISPFGQARQQNPVEEEGFFEKYFDAVASVILLILAYLFVIFYKRRQY